MSPKEAFEIKLLAVAADLEKLAKELRRTASRIREEEKAKP